MSTRANLPFIAGKHYVLTRPMPIKNIRLFDVDDSEELNLLMKYHKLKLRRWRKLKNKLA